MKIPLQKISDPAIIASGVNLFILRLDQTHPHISGNKWYKLKYNLQEAKKQKKETLLTFGGAFSNHVWAVAAAGREHNFKTIGIIRGDELTENDNKTLSFAKECGMQLQFVPRDEYRKVRTEPTHLLTYSPAHYILPEGGTNELAVKGCAEILSLIDIPFDVVCCPVGTGGTIAGIISSSKKDQKAIGFSVLKAPGYLELEIKKLLSNLPTFQPSDFDINEEYHFGGYAKHTPELLRFISDFERQNNIPLEQVYTGKMMFGIYELIKKGHFKRNETIVAIHTGGLQGKLHQHTPV